MRNAMLLTVLIVLGMFYTTSSRATLIETTAITASTTLGQFAMFPHLTIDKLNDGVIGDSPPYNGYASGFADTSGLITLSLDQPYDLTSFSLWNDINLNDEGVRTFLLNFIDSEGFSLGTTAVLHAVSQFDTQVYDFGQTFVGVKTVEFNVLSSSLQIEIRELAFNGSATFAVPEPGTLLMFCAGMLGLVRFTRRRL
ncbi:PEP-CTERM sorting domain-containing protein [Pseudomonadales bacterium]|nr:PEP-CTERM sorting domain-containing protein [Pseudomonadales bacterium]MDC1083217.1 PEP-CTERM sorting domain-containing protein [Pseudomonadales bacterium]